MAITGRSRACVEWTSNHGRTESDEVRKNAGEIVEAECGPHLVFKAPDAAGGLDINAQAQQLFSLLGKFTTSAATGFFRRRNFRMNII